MRYLVGFLCVCALGVVPMTGCGGEDCAQPLSDYFCFSRASCPTYEDAVADATRAGGPGPRPCGDTRLIVWLRNIDGGGSVLYFDESDTLVAAESFGYGLDQCGGQILYGPVPDCPDEQWWRGSYCISCREPA
ncbi:MAG: hypothetical protein WBN15_01155 [Polyangiales bacterium]